MGAHIEWVCPNVGILRTGRDFHSIETYDDFEFVCTVSIKGCTAMFKGGMSKHADAALLNLVVERQAIRSQLPDDTRYVKWERAVRGKPRPFIIDLHKDRI
jgi:hypothetical protein